MSRRDWDRIVAAVDLQALEVALSCKKSQREEGSARASPVAAPILSQILSKREGRMLRLLSIGL